MTLHEVLQWALTAALYNDCSQPELEYVGTAKAILFDKRASQFWSTRSGPWPLSRLQAIVNLEAEFASQDRDVRTQSAPLSTPTTAYEPAGGWVRGGLWVFGFGGILFSLVVIEQFWVVGMVVGVLVVAGFLWNREKERRVSEMKAQGDSRAYDLSSLLSDLHRKQSERRERLARHEE